MPGGIIKLDEGWRLDAGHHLDQPPNALPDFRVPLPVKRKRGTMSDDIIPPKRSDRYLWWKNLHDNIDVEGPKISLSTAEIAEIKAYAADMIAKMEATEAADVALKGARNQEAAARDINEPAIRFKIRGMKTRPEYATSGVEGVLKLKGVGSVFDPNTFKPAVKVVFEGGQIKIDFTKGECDGVVIYSRLRGEMGWTRLAVDTSSPYYDTRPAATPGVAETREYYCIGIIDDVERGQASDSVSISIPG